jgi:4-amino-4-deoxy-L-arabinose transferase-like glycosyltransferase
MNRHLPVDDASGGIRDWILSPGRTGLLLSLLAVLVIFPTLGRSGLKDWDEAIYASVSRQIYLTGDLVRLSLNGEPYFNKPPLYFALTALCYAAFGISEFSARLVSAAFGVLGILLAYLLVARLRDKMEGLLTVLFLLSSVRYLGIVQHGRMESMTAFFVTLAVYGLARLAEGPRWTYVFFVSSGLCVLTKGAMGLLPFCVAAAYLALHGPARDALARRHVVGGAAVFLAIALPWFLLAALANGPAFLERSVGYEVGLRMARAVEGHEGTPLFYLVDIAFAKPSAWGFLLPVSVPYMLYRAWTTRSAALVLMSAFLAVPLCIFSLAVGTKLPWYGFTMYAPAAFSAVLLLAEARGKAAYLRQLAIATAVVLLLAYNFAKKDKGLAIRELGPAVKASLAEGEHLIAYRLPPQALHFYTGSKILTVQGPEGLRAHAGDLAVIRKKDLDGRVPGDPVFDNADFVLVRLGGQRP